jgi:hypoxanthine phosphoribosyltransferase
MTSPLAAEGVGTPSGHPRSPARVLISQDELEGGVKRIAAELSEAYDDGVVLVSVLKGSVIFLADVIRSMTTSPVIDFLAVSSYSQGSGRVRLVKDLDLDISGRQVVLVEDIVDTGLTLAYLLGELGRREPASLAVCTLLDKKARRILPTDLAFVGFEVPDEFVLGYGLDYAGRYRNLKLIASGDPAVLGDDPDAYVSQLYDSPDAE